MPFTDEDIAKANAVQREKYGDGYSEEMRRRQSLRKTHGTGGFRYLKEHDPEKFRQIIAEREARKLARKQIPHQTEDDVEG